MLWHKHWICAYLKEIQESTTYNSPSSWVAGHRSQGCLVGNNLHREITTWLDWCSDDSNITLSPESDPELLTSVAWGFDPGQGWCRVAGGITAEDYIAAQWRDDSGGCRLDWRPHTAGQIILGQQYPWLTQRPAACQQLVHENYRCPKGHGQGHHHGDLAVTQPGVVVETWVCRTIRLV